MEDKKNVQFQMRISSINVLRFSQYDIGEFDIKRDDIVEYQSSFGVKVMEESSEIGIDTTVKIKIQEINEYFGELKVSMKFNITPFANVITKEDSSYKIPDLLVTNLLNISTGTVRGILFEKLKGTVLQNEIFPLVDINKMMKSQEAI